VSTEVMRRPYDLIITNVPGPQVPLYAAGARLTASYPVLPLSSGHLLTVGVTSYEGEVFFGLNADRDAVSDLDVLAQCLLDALEELLDTTVRATSVRQPTRKASPAARRAAAKKAAARQESARKSVGQKRAAVRTLVSRAAKPSVRPGAAASAVPDAAPVKKAAAKKAPAKKAPAKKAPAKRAPAKKAAPKVTGEPG
jgi:diacylglycerol O-acyltransferase